MKEIDIKLKTYTDLYIGIVVSNYNALITQRLLDGAHNILLKEGVPSDNINLVRVPGAFEIPYAASCLAKDKIYAVDVIICIGAIIRGETAHFEYISNECSLGSGLVSILFGKPVIFSVLTTDNVNQAMERSGGRSGNKGEEAARAALQMAGIKRKFDPGGKPFI